MPDRDSTVARRAAVDELNAAADAIQALHPGEVKNSVVFLRERAARLAAAGTNLGTAVPPAAVPGWDDYFLGIAAAVSVRGKCTRRQVGCVLVVDRRIIGTGYNGAAPGLPDCLEGACPRGRQDYSQVAPMSDYDQVGAPGFCIAIHAEVNAVLHSTRDTNGAVAYITDEPCPGCRKVMAAAGIARAVWPGGELAGDQLTRFESG